MGKVGFEKQRAVQISSLPFLVSGMLRIIVDFETFLLLLSD